jgi:hypothetical protein
MLPSRYYPAATTNNNNRTGVEREIATMISIHPYITVIGVSASIITFCFCTALVLVPLVTDYQGNLTYISNGMENHCGWSGTVLGSCAVLIAACEMIAALHTTMPTTLSFVVLLQASTWCMIIGVSDTGWIFHYIVLTIFLFSTLYFHYNLCRMHPFESSVYFKVNIITFLNTFLFFLFFVITALMTSEWGKWLTLDITVSLELTLMCCLTAQNLCVMRVLHQYKSIHLLYERQSS